MWRIQALNEAGGWKDRTTVEDMDLAVRASLHGWKFVYLGDLKVCSPRLAFCLIVCAVSPEGLLTKPRMIFATTLLLEHELKTSGEK